MKLVRNRNALAAVEAAADAAGNAAAGVAVADAGSILVPAKRREKKRRPRLPMRLMAPNSTCKLISTRP
jgi:hypothetical protein